ncbi:hypothetical protein MPER_09385, partial [Moniliophthora perniciosa FA553]
GYTRATLWFEFNRESEGGGCQNSLYVSRSAFSYVTAVPSFILYYAAAKALWWALEQAGVVGNDSITSSINSTFSLVMQRQRDKAGVGPGDALYTFESFRREFGRCLPRSTTGDGRDGDLMSEVDLKVVLRYLERDKGVIVVDKDITSVDRGIIELKSAVDNLRRLTLNIQSKIEEFVFRVFCYCKHGALT